MSGENDLEKLKFDVRTQEWALKVGIIKPEDLKKHLQSLPDLANNSLPLSIEDEAKH